MDMKAGDGLGVSTITTKHLETERKKIDVIHRNLATPVGEEIEKALGRLTAAYTMLSENFNVSITANLQLYGCQIDVQVTAYGCEGEQQAQLLRKLQKVLGGKLTRDPGYKTTVVYTWTPRGAGKVNLWELPVRLVVFTGLPPTCRRVEEVEWVPDVNATKIAEDGTVLIKKVTTRIECDPDPAAHRA